MHSDAGVNPTNLTTEPDGRLAEAARLMLEFAGRSGLTTERIGRRYLWTDAFAVSNFLSLARATGERRFEGLALSLVERVHATLGRHRPDAEAKGWLSGSSEAEGREHPTRGGLRIGKRLRERRAGEAYDTSLEWDRDGQYFHYLTQWMHALDQLARFEADPRYNLWGRELAETAVAAFADPQGGGLFWKMSADLSRPLVPGKSPHDPLDGFVAVSELAATAEHAGWLATGPSLTQERAALARMLRDTDWPTTDPLGIGGLLLDACRLAHLPEGVPAASTGLAERALAAALEGLRAYVEGPELRRPPAERLAFRELGLAIGLRAIETVDATPELLAGLRRYAALGPAIERVWLSPTSQRTAAWREHRDINSVMLATSLVPACAASA